MVVVMQEGASEAQILHVTHRLEAMGLPFTVPPALATRFSARSEPSSISIPAISRRSKASAKSSVSAPRTNLPAATSAPKACWWRACHLRPGDACIWLVIPGDSPPGVAPKAERSDARTAPTRICVLEGSHSNRRIAFLQFLQVCAQAESCKDSHLRRRTACAAGNCCKGERPQLMAPRRIEVIAKLKHGKSQIG